MKYRIKAVKVINHFLEFEVEANSRQEAETKVWNLGEDNKGVEVNSDCTNFEILETQIIN